MTLDHPLYHEAATVVTMPHGDEGLADGTRPGREVVSGKLPDENQMKPTFGMDFSPMKKPSMSQ